MLRPVALAGLLIALLPAGVAVAGGNECFYNGKKHDDRYGKPKAFTGEYTCKDMETGKLVLREHHVRGLRSGDYTKYDFRSGKVEETGSYRDDKLHGPMRRYRDGVVYLEYVYVRGRVQGVQKQFEGGKVSRVYLVDEQGKVETDLGFNEKGQLTRITCRNRPIGPEDEIWCGFNGKQSTVTLYDDEGRKRATEQFLAGRQHGLYRRFNVTTGAVIEEARYENGQRLRDGERHLDRQGALLFKTDCDAARTTCTETELFDGGKEPRTITVRRGDRMVKRTELYQNGKTRREIVIGAGSRVTISSYYDNGQLESKGTYLEVPSEWQPHLPDGLVESYEKDGTPWSRLTYARGKLHGAATRFRVEEGRQVREEAQYDQGKLVRQKIFLDDVLAEESEYFPDGSLKSRRQVQPPPPATKI